MDPGSASRFEISVFSKESVRDCEEERLARFARWPALTPVSSAVAFPSGIVVESLSLCVWLDGGLQNV